MRAARDAMSPEARIRSDPVHPVNPVKAVVFAVKLFCTFLNPESERMEMRARWGRRAVLRAIGAAVLVAACGGGDQKGTDTGAAAGGQASAGGGAAGGAGDQ